MNITLNAPPIPTGDAEKDTAKLYEWCNTFYTQMKRVLYSLDTSNILELDAERINGTISLWRAPIYGANVQITNNTVHIATPDGSQYLTLDASGLKFKGTVL